MKTYTIKDNYGNPFAFEIDNVYISLRKAAKLLASLDGIKDIRVRKLFERKRENHIEFEYAGNPFVLWEPYGDSSRYWIGPKDTEKRSAKIRDIEEIFINYKPAYVIRLLGDVLSLNFKGILKS